MGNRSDKEHQIQKSYSSQNIRKAIGTTDGGTDGGGRDLEASRRRERGGRTVEGGGRLGTAKERASQWRRGRPLYFLSSNFLTYIYII